MIGKEKIRELLSAGGEELSDEQIGVIRDGFYSLGYELLEWHKKYIEVSSEKIPTRGGEKKCP